MADAVLEGKQLRAKEEAEQQQEEIPVEVGEPLPEEVSDEDLLGESTLAKIKAEQAPEAQAEAAPEPEASAAAEPAAEAPAENPAG